MHHLVEKPLTPAEMWESANHKRGAEVNKKLDTHTKSLEYAKNTTFWSLLSGSERANDAYNFLRVTSRAPDAFKITDCDEKLRSYFFS